MLIECCNCGNTYPVEGNLFDQPVRPEPLLVCPHCNLEHVLSFHLVSRPHHPPPIANPSPRRPVKKLKLAQTYYASLAYTRICNSSRVDQSGGDDVNVTDWTRTNDIILATMLTFDKYFVGRTYKLEWRDVTAEGSFADVASTGEINYTASTVLTDANTRTGIEYKRCTQPSGYGWWKVFENEGDNACFIDSPSDGCPEGQWALDCHTATYSHEFAFRVYDVTEGAIIGVCGATLTIQADPSGQSQAPHMMHYARLHRS